jgi:hypothetical protein
MHSIWKYIFSSLIPRIRYDTGIEFLEFTKVHLQDMILNSGDSSLRHCILDFQEWRMQFRHESEMFMIIVEQC